MSKIVFINLFAGIATGGEVYFARLIHSLQERCGATHEYHLLSPANREMDKLSLPTHRIQGLNGKANMREIISFFQSILQIRSHLQTLKADIVIINGDRALYLAPFLSCKRLLGIKHMPINTFYKTVLSKIAFRSLDGVVTISNYHRDNYLANAHVPQLAEKITVIYNSVDTEQFQPPQAIIADKVIFLEVASLCARKGQMDALTAFFAMQRRECAELWFAGEGDARAEIEAFVAAHHLEDSVKILGFQQDTLKLYQQAHVVILPSYEEGMPLTLLEAMSSAHPVIATRVAGVPEIFTEGIEGFLVTAGDTNALRMRMDTLVENRQRLAAMGLAARARMQARFSQKQWIKEWIQLIEKV